MTTFLLIRHGANDYLGRALAGRLPDVHLNAAGRQQAEILAERLAATTIHSLGTSPQERARETAMPLARRFGLEPQVMPELAEVDFGAWTGKALTELEPLPAWRSFHAYRSCTRAPGGESMLEAQGRIVGLLQRLCGEDRDQTIALFSHADPIKAAVCFFLGISLDLCQRIEISPASLTTLTIGPDGPRFLVINQTVA